MTRERDRLQASNDHLAAEVDLACAEILDLQTEYADIVRDWEDSEEQRWILGERDRALASAAEAEARVVQIRSELESRQQRYMNTVSEFSRLRAVHNATLVDLDREVAARTSSDRVAEVARTQLSELQDREDLRLRHEAACRERDTARRQLSMVASIVGASPRTRPEREGPAALLRLLREDPALTSEHPTPRYLTYGDLLETPPKKVDPHNLRDPMTSAASKRPREDSNTPDPNSESPDLQPSPHLSHQDDQLTLVDPSPAIFMGLHYTETVTICASSQKSM
ncbi:unnamed protein product [Phytophthora fragariaefolia]|uniref:Unnamed protein product n=1 Tax=Phytophthora fragariaefolia TaxID=1490495 RepID=A0A9W6YI94_9STRA|nr:unnamed protein product [Phytophthora fragariaefolia]